MTNQERIEDDMAQIEYLQKWKTKRQVRRFYRTTILQDIKYLWKNIKAYVKGKS